MDLLSENRRALAALHPQLAQTLDSLPPSPYRLEPSRQGPPTVRYGPPDRAVYLHSRFDPQGEAEKIVVAAGLTSEHIVVLGLGLGYSLMEVLARKPVGARVLLVEPDLELVRLSLATIPWGELLKRDDLVLALGSGPEAIGRAVSTFVQLVTFEKIETIELSPEVRLAETEFARARQVIDAEIRTLLIDFQTRLAEDSIIPRNMLGNLPCALDNRPLAALRGKFVGVPGIIVAAGPSLDQNVLELRRVNDRAVVIAVDTALIPLLARGIQPHFTVVADPSYKNYSHLLGTGGQVRHFVVATMGVAPRVFADFSGRLFTGVLENPLARMIEAACGPIGRVQAWGSVISMALDVAVQLGLDPIVFIGQDFAFTGMRNHCRHTSWEETWLASNPDPDLLERKERESIVGSGRMVEAPDLYGRLTYSSERLVLYKNFLLKLLREVPGRRFINASEGGILTEIESRSLTWVLREFVTKRAPLDLSWLSKLPEWGTARNRRQLLVVIRSKTSFFARYQRRVTEVAGELRSSPLPVGAALDRLLAKAERVKGQLYELPENGELLEMWSQSPIFHLLKRIHQANQRGGDPGETLLIYQEYFDRLAPLLAKVGAALLRAERELAAPGNLR